MQSGGRGIGNLLGQGVVTVLQVEQAEVHPGLVILEEKVKEKEVKIGNREKRR